MAAVNNVVGIVLLLTFIAQGINGQCHLSDLSVKQSGTGATVKEKPEWQVTVTNDCACVQLNVTLSCPGFQTVEALDPSILSVSGNDCLLNNGQPISRNYPISFKYAWDKSFPLAPKSSQIACS